jgi:hypothetical protein
MSLLVELFLPARLSLTNVTNQSYVACLAPHYVVLFSTETTAVVQVHAQKEPNRVTTNATTTYYEYSPTTAF